MGGLERVEHGCTPSASGFSRCVKARNHKEQNRVQNNRVWQRACGLTATVVEGVRFDDKTGAIIVSVRPDSRARGRCGQCGRRSPGVWPGGWSAWPQRRHHCCVYSPTAATHHDSQADTDPQIQQESALCAGGFALSVFLPAESGRVGVGSIVASQIEGGATCCGDHQSSSFSSTSPRSSGFSASLDGLGRRARLQAVRSAR